jgi:DNA excision repair protein ERCC-8
MNYFSLLTGCSDGTWYIHDTFNLSKRIDHEKKCVGQCTRGVAHQRSIGTVEWYPSDNGMFVSSSSDGRLCLWDANNSSKPVEQYDLEENITRHQINPCCGTTIASRSKVT